MDEKHEEEKIWLSSAIYMVLKQDLNDQAKLKQIIKFVEAYEAMKEV